MASPRVTGVRSMQRTGPVRIRRATGPVPMLPSAPSGELIPSAPGAGPANGTPQPRSVLADAESNGRDTRLVAGDLRGSPPSAERRKRRATWPFWAAGATALAVTG